MTLLKTLKYSQKIRGSFGLLIVLLVISGMVSVFAVQNIVQQFGEKNRLDTIITNAEDTRLLVNDYIHRPTREKSNEIYQKIKQTQDQLTVSSPFNLDTQSMRSLLDEFQLQFQKYVILVDQNTALRSQTLNLGKVMINEMREATPQLVSSQSQSQLVAISNKILTIMWLGETLIAKSQPLTPIHLEPIDKELETLSQIFMSSNATVETKRQLYRIHKATRDYVESFQNFLSLEEQSSDTEKLLYEISNTVHSSGSQLSFNVQSDIESRLITTMSLLALVLLTFVITAILLSRYLTTEIVRPVKKLVNATHDISEGKLSINIDINTEDELGELANCLNTMAHTIQDNRSLLLDKNQALTEAQQGLEAKVEKRTQDLAAANQALITEVSAREQSEARIRQSEEKFRAMFELSPLGIIRTNVDGTIRECNQAFANMLGYSPLALVNQNEKAYFHPRYANMHDEKKASLLDEGVYGPHELQLLKQSGDTIAVSLNSLLIELDNENSVWSIIEDITERKKSEEMIWRQANFDPLTTLPNRRMFQDRLEREISIAKRTGSKFSLMLLDLDKFKEVNDTLGHDKGDVLLTEAAKRLKNSIRESDEVARFGGDEFTIIINNLHHNAELSDIGMKIIHALSQPFSIAGQSVIVGASIGITVYPDDADTPEKLISNADQAMYSAKSGGRNRYSFFTHSLQEKAIKRMTMINDLRTAIKEKQFSLLYQPIVNIQTQDVYKVEALIRWNHPTHGLISPVEFIPLAEETGLIVDIGDWVVEEVTRAGEKLGQQGYQLQISINKSPVQFKSDLLQINRWISNIKKVNETGNSILIEITEGLLLDASEDIRKILYTYRDEGIQVALDDFGTGYSSLAYLNKFDIDYLKIDQAFVKNLQPDSTELALYEAIIVMAHKLGLKVIAEGIEERFQHELLQKLGCDYGQGYLYSKPISFDSLITYLATDKAAVFIKGQEKVSS